MLLFSRGQRPLQTSKEYFDRPSPVHEAMLTMAIESILLLTQAISPYILHLEVHIHHKRPLPSTPPPAADSRGIVSSESTRLTLATSSLRPGHERKPQPWPTTAPTRSIPPPSSGAAPPPRPTPSRSRSQASSPLAPFQPGEIYGYCY